MTRLRQPVADYHAAWCRCADCRPAEPCDGPADIFSRRLALVTFAAIGAGLALVFLIDRASNGPGIFCMFSN